MSLATRCTACGTVFRVVQDQLKVSEGWVRCGRCNEVFNALQGLFDLERDPVPPPWTPPIPVPDDEPVEVHDPELVNRIDEQIFGSRRGSEPAAAAPQAAAEAPLDAGTDEPSVELSAEAQAVMQMDEPPEFVRRAERHARWRRSPMRLLLALAVLALLLVLLAQVANHQRDRIAAQWPAARPLLLAWCAALGCRIEAPRRIEDISVENTALAKVTGSDAFRLSVGLHNRAATPAAVPWIDLSLTDSAGMLLARRALAPKDFRAAPAALAAGGDATLQATLAASGARVAGYTVEIFYP
jgi:predicted Zn finger-like uncharacterized protein